jgi:serine protease Do
MLACVELFAPTGGGSGALISADGLILTNHHVIAPVIPLLAQEGIRFEPGVLHPRQELAELDEIIVGITLDRKRPSVALFRARLLAYDESNDFALCRIRSGYYGQPLPANYRFPFVEMGQASRLELGDTLICLGYPSIASLRSRPTLTVTRGIVAGFEQSIGSQLRLRTDAAISAGNSGGMALDEQWRLVGVPSMTVDDTGAEALAYAFSCEGLPARWLELIAAAQR